MSHDTEEFSLNALLDMLEMAGFSLYKTIDTQAKQVYKNYIHHTKFTK